MLLVRNLLLVIRGQFPLCSHIHIGQYQIEGQEPVCEVTLHASLLHLGLQGHVEPLGCLDRLVGTEVAQSPQDVTSGDIGEDAP